MQKMGDCMKKVYSLVGLAKRAGMAVCGEDLIKDCIRYGKSHLIIIAEDASDNTKKSITNSCKYYGASCYIAGTKEDLGHAMGKSHNAAVCITDAGFAKSIETHLQRNTNGGETL